MLSIEEVKAAILFDQPKLQVTFDSTDIYISGTYLLTESGASPNGPLVEYDIKILLSPKYPNIEPKVFEVGGQIPHDEERHINRGGDCCITVWEHWLATAKDISFSSFLNGPIRSFFFSQYWFDKTKKWPFKEYEHGEDGLLEAFADVLGVSPKRGIVSYYLRLLSQDWPKGHWACPCGSTKRLRHCHREQMIKLHEKVPPRLARRMLYKLISQRAAK